MTNPLVDQPKQTAQTLSVNDVELTPDLLHWVERLEHLDGAYATIFTHRTRYLWKWLQLAFQTTTLTNHSEALETTLSLRCRCGFIAILLDDLCDVHQNETDLQKAIDILQGDVPPAHADPYYHLLYDVWCSVSQALQTAPNYQQLAHEIDVALTQFCHSFTYCLSTPHKLLAGEGVWDTYIQTIPHSTSIYLAGLVDLLYVSPRHLSELETAKQLIDKTQQMAQIGNWITTHEREFQQNDLSSGLVVLAIEKGWLDRAKLRPSIDYARIAKTVRQSPAEATLLHLWQELQIESLALARQCDHVSREPLWQRYVENFSTILQMQKESVGLT